MKLLADENVKRRLVGWLKALGHDVELGEKGSKDSLLFALSKGRERVLLTHDTDFLNTALYPLEGTPGRIVLRIFPPTLKNQINALGSVFSNLKEHEYKSSLIEVWNNGFDIRTQ